LIAGDIYRMLQDCQERLKRLEAGS
jgi:hypothetical protein